jgi:hypothetical protein
LLVLGDSFNESKLCVLTFVLPWIVDMQTTLMHPEFHIRFALRLSEDHKLEFSAIVIDVLLFDKIFQTNDVNDGLLADPNLYG